MKEYLKMADVFSGKVKEGLTVNGPSIHGDIHAFYANTKDRRIAVYASHAINSHDELVAEVGRLRESLRWAVNNLPFENAFEWSDDENADAHYAALKLLGVSIEE